MSALMAKIFYSHWHRDFTNFCLLSVLLTCSNACAGSWDDDSVVKKNSDNEILLMRFRMRAFEGNSIAQYNLGQMYRLGYGIQINFEDAVVWYKLAAAQGNGPAQLALGMMYYKGQGVPANPVLAHMWFTISAMAGTENAAKSRNALAEVLSQDQLELSLELSRTCRNTHFEQCG